MTRYLWGTAAGCTFLPGSRWSPVSATALWSTDSTLSLEGRAPYLQGPQVRKVARGGESWGPVSPSAEPHRNGHLGEAGYNLAMSAWEGSIVHLFRVRVVEAAVAGSPRTSCRLFVPPKERGTDLFLMGKCIFSAPNHRLTTRLVRVKFLRWPLGVGLPLLAPPIRVPSLLAWLAPSAPLLEDPGLPHRSKPNGLPLPMWCL